MRNRKPKVVSIAAVAGGGKTTITTQLNKMLPKSKVLFFDDYEFDGPNDICDWVERGANYSEWKLEPFVNDICKILFDSPQSLEYISLDYPFAYIHNEMREYIDFTIFIDTPLDIAMGRRILRDFKESSIENVRDDLNLYLSRGRRAYLEMLNTVKPNCDLIVDGSLPVDTIVNQVYERIKGLEIN